MTDEPTQDPSDQPTQPTQPTDPTTPPPATPPSAPSGVGFAALHLPGQQPPSQPLPGQAPGYANPYQPPATPQGIPPAAYPPPPPAAYPPPPPPPGPLYQYDISRMPPNRAGGPSVLLVGGLAFILVLAVGVGALFALGIGPFARATPRPVPTLVAQPTLTAAPVTPKPTGVIASPAPSPTGGVAPSATPSGDPKAALLSHIPDGIADSCFVTTPDEASTIVAIALCEADGGDIKVTYFQYATYDSMFLAYSGFRVASQIEPDSGDCDDPATWPTENNYNIEGVSAGRLLCTEELSETSLYWTDDRLNILSEATHTKGNHQRLIDFWVRDSGPDL